MNAFISYWCMDRTSKINLAQLPPPMGSWQGWLIHDKSAIFAFTLCASGNSFQFSCSVMSDSLQPHEPQHEPMPSIFPSIRVFSNESALCIRWPKYWSFSFNIPPQFSSVQSLSRVCLLATPWIAAHQASLSITNSRSWLKLLSIESVRQSSHLILCHPLLLLSPIPPSIRVFSNESTLHMRWP